MKSKAKLQGRKAQIEEIKRKQQKLNKLTHQVSMLKKMTTSYTKSQNTTIPCKSKFIFDPFCRKHPHKVQWIVI